jgi:hypothetical protein
VAAKRLMVGILVSLSLGTSAMAADPISKSILSKSERTASILDYDNTTRVVVELSSEAGAHGLRDTLQKARLDRVEEILTKEGFFISRNGQSLTARSKETGSLSRSLLVEIKFVEGAVLASNPSAAAEVRVQWLTDVIAKTAGDGVADAHRNAERVRKSIVESLLAAPTEKKAEEVQGRVLLNMPVGSTVGNAAQTLDQIANRVSEINRKLKKDVGVIESRSEFEIVITFDVDQMFSMAPASVTRANKPMPVRVKYTIGPEKAGESNIQVLVRDLTGDEIDKFPEYVTWTTTGPLALIMSGR